MYLPMMFFGVGMNWVGLTSLSCRTEAPTRQTHKCPRGNREKSRLARTGRGVSRTLNTSPRASHCCADATPSSIGVMMYALFASARAWWTLTKPFSSAIKAPWMTSVSYGSSWSNLCSSACRQNRSGQPPARLRLDG